MRRDARLPHVPDAVHPSHRRVVEAAARHDVTLEVVTFSQSTHTAEEAARAIGAELSQIVKSLVFIDPDSAEPNVVVALVAGPDRVDVARLAKVAGLPSLRRATAREAAEATGFVIGGIPPMAHSRPSLVVMDPGLERHAVLWAAAGTPSAVFGIGPDLLRVLSGASVAPITQEPGGDSRP